MKNLITIYRVKVQGLSDYLDGHFDSLKDARHYAWRLYLSGDKRIPIGDYCQLFQIVRIRYNLHGDAVSYFYCRP